ncbi:MAG: 16S rRNA (guanine(966)-N(2))-methyltransferase RsmD [Kiritimatiellae bacterium]|nr:16S rRNA (guanine(966)-N(2))-methyltransferase RsmD [Kiritimatiellia bacterium]
MRIAGGEWRGRALKAPPGDELRPTQDRVREALFSMLMHETPGARFLDLFAGTGGVGLEALSRGAADCTFVELQPRHLSFLRENVAALSAEARCRLVRADAYAWLETFEGVPFDVAFADPPYELGVEKGYASVLATLAARNVVRPGGLFIAELTSRQSPEESPLWDLCRDRVYGQTRLAVYRRAH